MPAAAGKFAFQSASTGYTDVGETLGAITALEQVEGQGKLIDAANARIEQINNWRSAMQLKATEVATAASEQHTVDVPLTQAPSIPDLKEKEQTFRESKGEARVKALTAWREALDEHSAAVDTHESGTNPTPGKFETITPPAAPGGGGAGGGSQHHSRSGGLPGVENLPGTDPMGGNGSGGSSGAGGDDGGGGSPVGSTHLSGDTDLMEPASSGKPSLGPGGQPQFPPATLGQGQPQAQGQGAAPGMGAGGASGTGMPPMPPMSAGGGSLGKPNKKDDKKGRDPLDDLRGVLPSEGGTAVGGAAALGIDRGATAHGVHTNARISGPGTTAPTNLSSSGAPPGGNPGGPQGAGRGMGPMGMGPMGGGAATGSRGAKKAEDTPAAFQDRSLSGQDSIDESVEGGLISRSTSEYPESPFPEHPDEVAKRKAERAAEETARLRREEEEARRNSPPPGWE